MSGSGGRLPRPTTINADHRSLVRILNEAVLDGHLDTNPLAGMKKLRSPQRQRRYLTKEELGALITNCPEHFRPYVGGAGTDTLLPGAGDTSGGTLRTKGFERQD